MRPKEIVIISGKGGTGKTTVTSSLAFWMKKKGLPFVVADADVDAADMHILLEPKVIKEESFQGKSIAVIDQDLCTSCDICRQLCRFDAIEEKDGIYQVIPSRCDGCTLCEIACPVKAIEMVPQIVGKWFISDTRFAPMVHAKLNPGGENSGNLVTMVKHQARLLAENEGIPYIVIDGPPGIGCPVTSAISGADFAVIVAEPTLSAIHDMERAVQTARHFKVSHGIMINKASLNPENTEKIKRFAQENSIPLLGELPFDRCVVKALINKKTAIESCSSIAEKMNVVFDKILEVVSET